MGVESRLQWRGTSRPAQREISERGSQLSHTRFHPSWCEQNTHYRTYDLVGYSGVISLVPSTKTMQL